MPEINDLSLQILNDDYINAVIIDMDSLDADEILFQEYDEQRSWVYILSSRLSLDRPNDKRTVYVGKTQNLIQRLTRHKQTVKKKDLKVAIAFASKIDHELNSTHCAELEHILIGYFKSKSEVESKNNKHDKSQPMNETDKFKVRVYYDHILSLINSAEYQNSLKHVAENDLDESDLEDQLIIEDGLDETDDPLPPQIAEALKRCRQTYPIKVNGLPFKSVAKALQYLKIGIARSRPLRDQLKREKKVTITHNNNDYVFTLE